VSKGRFAATRKRVERVRTDALLVRSVVVGEADSIVTLFTEQRGIVSAMARGARRTGGKRLSALEPMHVLRVALDEKAGSELAQLAETAIACPRLGLVGDLEALEAAGRALRWVRRALPPHTPEPAIWTELNRVLDALDRRTEPPLGAVAGLGLFLLSALGWALELERCVGCGKPCDPAATAMADVARGGLVCRACGGGGILLRGNRRARLLAALAGSSAALEADDVHVALDLVDRAFAAHTGAKQDQAGSK
jgi:DNA repair protein RecO (recombination protein O)